MPALPDLMTAVEVPQPGGPESMQLKQVPLPQLRPGEVLIRVATAGVNRPDVAQRSGVYPPPPDASPRLGLEVSGQVVALGTGVSEWKVGDDVCALTPGGGYAEYCATPAGQCLPLPAGLSLDEAAGLPENFFTVWSNVFDRGRLRAGEIFLVHGGSSGIGVTAIQLAKAFGARVITTAGSEEKCQRCRELGADLAINYKSQDFVAAVRDFTRGQGVSLILDMVGGAYFQRNIESLGMDGRLVHIASLQGDEISLKISQIMRKRLTISGSMLRPRTVSEKTEIAQALREKVWPLFAAKKVRVVVDQTFALKDVVRAHQRLESSEHIGKILLRVQAPT